MVIWDLIHNKDEKNKQINKKESGKVFAIHSRNVKVLSTPEEFYDQLIDGIRNAKERITLASLYLGTGEREQQLVEELEKKCKACPEIQISILLDYSRALRGHPTQSSLTMLEPLLKENCSKNLNIRLYKVPQLGGLFRYLPSPLDEIVGVSHIKAYVFDDTLIMSGANLSEEYFFHRQDRYMVFSHASGIANIYHSLIDILSLHAFRVSKDSQNAIIVEPRESNNSEELRTHLQNLIGSKDEHTYEHTLEQKEEADTWIVPTLQLTPLHIYHDQHIVQSVITSQPNGGEIAIASGYLNLPTFFTNLLMGSLANIQVITAAPQANGFFKAKGIKSAIPTVYSLIEQQFYSMTKASNRVQLYEYNRNGWTFHAKGMWCIPPHEHLPNLTMIGSPNFGRRSYERDLESQVLLYTTNDVLREKLKNEYEQLKSYSEYVDENVWRRPDRQLKGFGWKLGHWIRPVSRIIIAYL